jgi:predicted dehydrogenase
MTRRAFLRHGSRAACAAAAVPFIIPASALGRDGHVAPSERTTVGFIGVGGQGRGHLLGGAWTYIAGGYTAREDVQLLAICDVIRDRREEACRAVNAFYAARSGSGAYRCCEAVNDFRNLLARSDIDAVLVATPIHWHETMTILAARAGKDIYCEKPTAITIRASRAMADTVTRYGRVFQAGTQQRSEYGGNFRTACTVVRSGMIGDVREVYAWRPGGTFSWQAGRGTPLPVPDGLDWDLFLGPAPWMPYDGVAHAHRFCGVGDINWGPHHYDFIQWALGMDHSGPIEVFFEGDVLQYRYANGVVVHACGCPEGGPGAVGGARFIGTRGWVAADRDGIAAEPPSLLRSVPDPRSAGVYYSTSHSGNFLECVRTRQPTICGPESSHRAASMVILGGLALELKRPLKWDPAKETFPGDDEANRLLSTAFRAPWCV